MDMARTLRIALTVVILTGAAVAVMGAGELRHKDVGQQITKDEWESTDTHFIANGAAGDMLYGSTTGTLVRLPVGTAGQVLVVATGTPGPAWVPVSIVAPTPTPVWVEVLGDFVPVPTAINLRVDGDIATSSSLISVNDVLAGGDVFVGNDIITTTGQFITGGGYITSGGNARGTGATDLQTVRAEASKVASGYASVISGGTQNTASGDESVVSGGTINSASGDYSVVAGGSGNAANGDYSAVLGGYLSSADGDHGLAFGRYAAAGGDHSVAIGYYAQTTAPGAWAFSDSTAAVFAVATPNSLGMRFSGGVDITGDLRVSGTVSPWPTPLPFTQNANYGIRLGTDAAVGTNESVAIGYRALGAGGSLLDYNTAVGHAAGYQAFDGSHVFIGYEAGAGTNADKLTAVGYQALKAASTSEESTAVGYGAGNTWTGANLIALGFQSGKFAGDHDNTLAIGHGVWANQPNMAVIGGSGGRYYNKFFLGSGASATGSDLQGVTISATDSAAPTPTVEAGAAVIIKGGEGSVAGGAQGSVTIQAPFSVKDSAGSAEYLGIAADGATVFAGSTVFNEAGADVDLRVESDGNENMLFVDGENNRVGIGTETPAEVLDVVGNVKASGTLAVGGAATVTGAVGVGMTPSQPLEVAGTIQSTLQSETTGAAASLGLYKIHVVDGSPSETLDTHSIGAVTFYGHGSSGRASGASITAIQIGAAGTTRVPIRLGLRTSPGGTTAPQERLSIMPDGKVGIGTTTPASELHVSEAADGYAAEFFNDGNTVARRGIKIQCGEDTLDGDDNVPIAWFDGNGDAVGGIYFDSGTTGAFGTSDEALKTEIRDSPIDGAAIVKALPVRRYERLASRGISEDGFIAQEVEAIMPDAVLDFEYQTTGTVTLDDGTTTQGQVTETVKCVKPDRLIPVLWQTVQEQQATIEALQASVKALEARLEKLEARR